MYKAYKQCLEGRRVECTVIGSEILSESCHVLFIFFRWYVEGFLSSNWWSILFYCNVMNLSDFNLLSFHKYMFLFRSHMLLVWYKVHSSICLNHNWLVIIEAHIVHDFVNIRTPSVYLPCQCSMSACISVILHEFLGKAQCDLRSKAICP